MQVIFKSPVATQQPPKSVVTDNIELIIPSTTLDYVGIHDVGGNSYKATGYEIVRKKSGSVCLIQKTKFGEQYGLGGSATINDPHPVIVQEGANRIIAEGIPGWRTECEKKEFKSTIEFAIGTEPIRAVLELGTPEEQAKVHHFIDAHTRTVNMERSNFIVASQKLEAELAAEAAVLAGFHDGIVFMCGGNSIEIIHLKNGQMVDNHWAVIRMGSRSLQGRQDIPEIFLAELKKIEWLAKAMKETNRIMIEGGTYRGPGRLGGSHIHGEDYLVKHLPVEGYPFIWHKTSIFRAFMQGLQPKNAESVFREKFGRSEQAIRESVTKRSKKVIIRSHGKDGKFKSTTIKIEEFNVASETFKRKIAARAHTWLYTIPLLTALLDYHEQQAKDQINTMISPVSIRDSFVARITGATHLSYT